jgi:hypothetical protein
VNAWQSKLFVAQCSLKGSRILKKILDTTFCRIFQLWPCNCLAASLQQGCRRIPEITLQLQVLDVLLVEVFSKSGKILKSDLLW